MYRRSTKSGVHENGQCDLVKPISTLAVSLSKLILNEIKTTLKNLNVVMRLPLIELMSGMGNFVYLLKDRMT